MRQRPKRVALGRTIRYALAPILYLVRSVMNESSLVLLNRASMMVLKGLIQDALSLLEGAIRDFPFDPRPLERTADLYRGLGRIQDAVRAYLAAADLYAQAGTPVRALDLCKRVLELDPQNSKAHRILKNAPPPRDDNEFMFDESADGSTVATDEIEFEPTTLSNEIINEPIEFESTSVTQTPVPDFDELTPTIPRKMPPNPDSFKKIEIPKNIPVSSPTPTPMSKPASFGMTKEASMPRAITGALPITARAVPVKTEPSLTSSKVAISIKRSAYSVPPSTKTETPPTGIQLSKLPSIPLFAELPPKAFREVLGAAIRKQFKPREVICREGELGKSCFILLSGEVEVWRLLPTGRRSIARLGSGDFFGEMSSISQLPRSANVEAIKQTELLEVPWDIVSRLAAENKPVEAVLHRFYKRRVLDNLALSSRLFGAFTNEERETLVRSFVIREAKVGERLLIEGVHANGFYVLLSATCEMMTANVKKKQVIMQKLRAGDFFGGGSILESRPALVTVQVSESGRVLYFARKSFYEVMQNHAAARSAVAPLLAERRRLAEKARQNESIAGGRIEMP
jgi:cAMP-dependent protein kinase regulator